MSEAELSLLSQPVVIIGLVLLLIIELGFMLWAIIDWAKRPADRIRGNRILWLLLILLVNIAGPIIYLTVGRLPAPPADDGDAATGDRARAAVDTLYGQAGGTDDRG